MIVPSDVPAAIEKLGIGEYKISGDELKARCPHPDHYDRNPSWSINLETGLFNCFSCSFCGSFVNLVELFMGVDYEQALEWCMGLPMRKIEIPDSPREISRPLMSLEGFTLPPADMIKNKKLTAEACDKHQLLWSGSAWIAPVRDPRTNNLWGWQEKYVSGGFRFKNVPDNLRKSEAVFGIQHVVRGSTLVLVESPIDVVRLESAGISGGVSSYGVHVSDVQLQYMLRGNSLVLALDNDADGIRETARLLRKISGSVRTRVFEYGDTGMKDPGEMTDDQIFAGIDSASSGIVTRFGTKTGNKRWR